MSVTITHSSNENDLCSSVGHSDGGGEKVRRGFRSPTPLLDALEVLHTYKLSSLNIQQCAVSKAGNVESEMVHHTMHFGCWVNSGAVQRDFSEN